MSVAYETMPDYPVTAITQEYYNSTDEIRFYYFVDDYKPEAIESTVAIWRIKYKTK